MEGVMAENRIKGKINFEKLQKIVLAHEREHLERLFNYFMSQRFI